MQQVNVEDSQKSIQNKGDLLFVGLVTVGFFYGTLFGFVLYSLPKFLISIFLLKKQDSKYKIARDTAVAGLIFGILVLVGTYSDTQLPKSTDTNVAVESRITKSSTDEEIIGSLYRNTKYNFRINFPNGWEIKDGDGQHIVKKATNQDSSINIGVTDVSNFPEADSIHSIGQIADRPDGPVVETN